MKQGQQIAGTIQRAQLVKILHPVQAADMQAVYLQGGEVRDGRMGGIERITQHGCRKMSHQVFPEISIRDKNKLRAERKGGEKKQTEE